MIELAVLLALIVAACHLVARGQRLGRRASIDLERAARRRSWEQTAAANARPVGCGLDVLPYHGDRAS